MKTLKISTLVFMAIILNGVAIAQNVKVVSGNLNFLKGQSTLKVEYDYGNGDMDVGRYENESDYIKDKIKEKNEKEPGSGDAWYEAWVSNRKERFQPKFEESVNIKLENSGLIICSDCEDAEFTMILKTHSTEPGFNVGITRRPAWISVEIIFVETKNPNIELSKIKIEKAVQRKNAGGFDFDVAYRIENAYWNCGEKLGKFLVKNALK